MYSFSTVKVICKTGVHYRLSSPARCTMELRENLAGHTLQICQYIRPPTCNFDMRDACLSLLSELPCLCASPSYKASLADASTCARSLATCYSHLHGDSTVAAMNGVYMLSGLFWQLSGGHMLYWVYSWIVPWSPWCVNFWTVVSILFCFVFNLVSS